MLSSIRIVSLQVLILIGLAISLAPLETRAQFASTATLSPLPAVRNTADKPQSKVWKYDGKWWSVLSVSEGTFIFRLDGNTWTRTLRLTTSTSLKADCKVVNNVTHIFLWRSAGNVSNLYSVEYEPASSAYRLWSVRSSATGVSLETGTETGTIDIDSNNRMWLTTDATNQILVRHSNYPYNSWSAPIVLASGVSDDDISAVIALKNQRQIGVLWSNQVTKRFGFRIHNDNDPVDVWSSDEAPGADKAVNIGSGLGDDHMNLKYASDGSLYAAIKTSYDRAGYPRLGLFKRFPDGSWSDLMEVSQTGTRAIVLLNEQTNKMKVVFSELEDGGNILYKESDMTNVAFGPTFTLLSGVLNNASGPKDNHTTDVVVIASSAASPISVVGVYATDGLPPAPAVPALTSPANLATSVAVNPVLTWSAALNANSYNIQVATGSSFDNIIFAQNSIAATSQQVNGLANNTTYFWRVQAVNASGSSDWSQSRSFTTIDVMPGIPALVSPADLASNVSTSPQLTWNAAVNATGYNVQVSATPDFSANLVDLVNVSGPSVQAQNLENSTTYHWRVQATNQFGVSNWTAARSFTTVVATPNAPTLVSPADATVDVPVNVLFSWNAVATATSYSLQASLSPTFSNLAVNESGLTSAAYQASGLANSSLYYWRVRASNVGGTSAWSDVFSFTTIAVPPSIPVLNAPANGALNVSVTPILSWSATTANAFQVQVSTSGDFAENIIDQSGLTATTLQLPALNNSTQYFWRVRSSNLMGTSDWSQTASFTTVIAAPQPPLLLAPENNATNVATNPVFSWTAVDNATSYTLQISASASFSTLVINRTGLNTPSSQVVGLANGTLYYWRVSAVNIGGATYSATSSFTTTVLPPAAPVLASPANNAVQVGVPVQLSWNAVTAATSYNLQVALSPDFATPAEALAGITTTSVQLPLQNSTQYFWRVQAVNAGGASVWSATRNFTTMADASGNKLVGYWAMNEGSGTTINDGSDFGNTGSTVGGAGWTTGVTGTALALSGKQIAVVPDAPSLDVTQSITLAAWIRPSRTASQVILKKGSTGGADGYELTLLSTGKVQFRINQNTSPYSGNSNTNYPADGTTWMHVAATYDGASIRLYINGVLDRTTVVATPREIAANASPVNIGGETAKKSVFAGALDEVRIYNYALTPSEISSIAALSAQVASASNDASTVEILPERLVTGDRLDFYPNPVEDIIHLDFNGEDTRDVTVAIADAQGRVHYKTAPAITDTKLEIDTRELNVGAGINFLIVKSPRYQKVFKFIKK